MKHFKEWLRLLLKYSLKKKAFWILTAVLLLFAAAAYISGQEKQAIHVALYCENADELTEYALSSLTLRDDELYSFYISPSEAMLKEDVASHKAECGYVFAPDLRSRLRASEEKLITVYTSSSTVLDSMIDEAVYSAIFADYAKTMAADFISDKELTPNCTYSEIESLVSSQYAWEAANSPTFHVTYENIDEDFFDNQTAFRIPLRGLISLLILIAALAGSSQYSRDCSENYFLLRFAGERIYVPLLYTSIPALLISVIGFACLALSGNISGKTVPGLILELVLLIVYAIVCAVFSFILCELFKSSLAFDALIPSTVLLCLVLSPIIADLSGYIPAGTILKWFAPTTWYLNFSTLIS